MNTVNHNVIWTTINHLKRIIRELKEGYVISDKQKEELITTLNECKELLDGREQ